MKNLQELNTNSINHAQIIEFIWDPEHSSKEDSSKEDSSKEYWTKEYRSKEHSSKEYTPKKYSSRELCSNVLILIYKECIPINAYKSHVLSVINVDIRVLNIIL